MMVVGPLPMTTRSTSCESSPTTIMPSFHPGARRIVKCENVAYHCNRAFCGALASASTSGYHERMLSESKLNAYRQMTFEERWQEVEQLMTFAWRFLNNLPP